MCFHQKHQPCGSCGNGGNSLDALSDKSYIYLTVSEIEQNKLK